MWYNMIVGGMALELWRQIRQTETYNDNDTLADL